MRLVNRRFYYEVHDKNRKKNKMIKLYNSKSNKVEEFKPIVENKVNMYVCGPTVYNHAHIGNARPVIVFDTLRRLFESCGYDVKYASNFTDVDDKIINKAQEENVSESVISQRYIDAYSKLRDELNTLPLYATPKVTQVMDKIISFINSLVESGNAYESHGDVYFSVTSIDNYGVLSKQKIEDLLVGARIDENTKKVNPSDFTLWKKTEKGLKWDSPWSTGRPGWHTECVVMIKDVFADMIDIHGGGMDLRFPHHDNEIAQSCAFQKHELANFWMHNAMINIDGEKMSKSLGNVRWAKDIVDLLGTNVVRWLMLGTHYRSELNFSDETIETAKKELSKVETALKLGQVKLAISRYKLDDEINEDYDKFISEMSNDLNTANAYAQIFDSVKKINSLIRANDDDLTSLKVYINSVIKMLDVLGISVKNICLNDEEILMYEQWVAYKKAKDFDNADKLRNILVEKGVL